MSFVEITTNNMSRQLRNSATYIDNWVYVPGTAITGDWKQPYAFRSLDEFQKACGTRSPEGSITYEYVAGLLSAGLPVLFRRIAYQNQNTVTEEDIVSGSAVGVKRAEFVMEHVGQEAEETIQDLKITEKYGGTFGNDINITIRPNNNTYYIEVYNQASLLERHKFATVSTDIVDQTEINQKLMDGLKALNTSLERINIEILEEDPSKFSLQLITNQYLSGGEDISETLVAAEIPNSLSFITDKILYQPKFLTSGGYTDTNMETATPIADALEAVSETRQDCRALIDLPIGVPAEEQQSLAAQVSYQQNSNTKDIPSASMCAPWLYMQVGNEQLWMPPSFAYLTVVGSDISRGGRAYTPKAGLTNGIVANVIRPEFEIGSDLSEAWQSDSQVNINPIMKLQSGSYVIEGNSTLLMPDSEGKLINAFLESSADLTIIEIRRYVYNLAVELRFQYNSTEAFETFSLRMAKFLETMITEGAVMDYTIVNASTNDEPRTLNIILNVDLTPTIKNIKINLNVSYGSINVTTTGGES